MLNHKRVGRAVAVAISLSLLAACGSHLDHAQHLAANGAIGLKIGSVAQNQVGPSGATASEATQLDTGATGTAAVPGEAAVPGQAGASPATPAAAAPGSPATGTPVVIGFLGLTSGLLGSILGTALTGVQAWVQHVNQAGGLNGHPVQLISYDTGGNPSTALADARSLVEEHGAIAIVGVTDPLSDPTIAKYLESVNVPAIGGLLVGSTWFTSRMYFPQGAGSEIDFLGGVSAGIRDKLDKVGIVVCVEFAVVCKLNGDYVADHLPAPGSVVYRAEVSLAQPDYTSVCLGAKNAGVDNLMVALDPTALGRLVNSCDNQDYHPRIAVAGIILSTSLKNYPAVNAYAISSEAPFPADTPETAEFRQAVRDATGADPTTQIEMAGWVSGKLLEAASRNLSATPTAAEVIAGLYALQGETLGGLIPPLTFNNGAPATAQTCGYVLTFSEADYHAPQGLAQECL